MEANDLIVRQVLDTWWNKVEETTSLFDTIGEQNAMWPVAPGKNRVIYLLGHLLVIHDGLLTTLEIGERRYASYDELFLTPQHTANVYPPYTLLLDQWIDLNMHLRNKLAALTGTDWLSKHHHISEENFRLQPGKNKFCALLCMTTHLFHHAGQLALISV